MLSRELLLWNVEFKNSLSSNSVITYKCWLLGFFNFQTLLPPSCAVFGRARRRWLAAGCWGASAPETPVCRWAWALVEQWLYDWCSFDCGEVILVTSGDGSAEMVVTEAWTVVQNLWRLMEPWRGEVMVKTGLDLAVIRGLNRHRWLY